MSGVAIFISGVATMGLTLTAVVGFFPDWFFKEHDRRVAEKAWDLARREIRTLPSWYNPETGKGGFDLQPLGPDESSEEGAWNAVMEILDDNPYRKADR